MALQISWSIEGDRQLSRRLRGVSLAMSEWRKPLGNAALKLRRTFETDAFRTRGRAIGASWKPLSPVTIAQKARSGYPLDPLVRTGRMKRNFKTDIGDTQATIYNPTPYFKYHQSNQPRTRLPRRQMMRIGHNQRTLIVREFQSAWIQKIRKRV